MTWGNDVVQWWASDEGWRVLTGAVIPGLAILVAGLLAALIARSSTKRLLAHHDRDARTSAIGAFVLAGRTVAEWHDQSDADRQRTDRLISEAETRLRLLPVPGAALAANWAVHQLEAMKGHSSGFRFQAQQTLGDYRDALIAWSQKPRAAKKIFGADLERWRYGDDEPVALDEHQARVESASGSMSASGPAPEPAPEPAPGPVAEPSPATSTVRDPALAAALAAAPPPTARPAVSPTVVDDSVDAPEPTSASVVRERITSHDQY